MVTYNWTTLCSLQSPPQIVNTFVNHTDVGQFDIIIRSTVLTGEFWGCFSTPKHLLVYDLAKFQLATSSDVNKENKDNDTEKPDTPVVEVYGNL